MALRIEHDLDIEAPPETVWRVLTDFDAYPEWNPFVVSASSTLKVGEPMDMRVRVLPFLVQPQREWVVSCEPLRGFCYAMSKQPGRLLHSRRCHELEPLDSGGTRYASRFALEGPLSGLVQAMLGRSLRRGFGEMSEAVKLRAEGLSRDEPIGRTGAR